MSAYSDYQTIMREQEFLVAALKEMGFNPSVHETPHYLEGFQGDKRSNCAHIIIPRHQVGGAANDIGFLRGEEGVFTAIISSYDGRSGEYDATWLGKLTQLYSDNRTISRAEKLGYKLVGKTVVPTATGQKHRLEFEKPKQQFQNLGASL